MSLTPEQTPMEQPAAKIDRGAVIKARQTLREYKDGKAQLEKRVISSEQWYRLRSWEEMDKDGKPVGNENDARPRSAWLFNVLLGKQADAVEAYPEPILLPRALDDKAEAENLTNIVPLIMEGCGFEQTYSDNSWKKLRTGTAVYGVFGDKGKHGGLGDVAIRKIDLLNLFWEPGIDDIQESRNLFHAELVSNEVLEELYPQLVGKLKKGGGSELNRYNYDDNVRTENKSLVVDWYYKRVKNGRKVLHYCKFTGESILFASENNPEMAESGWYDDGEYPYVTDTLFPIEGTFAGLGYVDIGKSPQEAVDLLGQQLVKNAVMSATPRYFINMSGKVNEEEFADWTKPLIHVDGAITPESITPVQVSPMSGHYINIYQSKLDEMKFTTGNQDVQNGGTGGMTTASGIAAMQESAGRSSKASTKGTYRAYSRIVNMVIERIRQFYDIPRTFRVLGQRGVENFISYTNERIKAQPQGDAFGVSLGYRLPVFDIQVRAAKQTPFSRQAQNDLAVQLFGMGVFNPQMGDQVVPMLEMMDFPGREEVLQKVMQNQQLLQQLQMAAQIAMALTEKYEPNNLQPLAQALGIAPPQQPQGRPVPGRQQGIEQPNPEKPKEAAIVENSRARAQQAGQPE